MFQYRVWRFDPAGELGLALAHPLYIYLARFLTFLPLGEFAFRVNLLSAICAAASLGVCIDLLLSLTRSRLAAIVGTIVLAVSHTFWTHAVIAEVYDLYALCLLLELWLLERFFARRQARWLMLALFVNGLSFSNHVMAILHAPVYLAIIIWALRRRIIAPQHFFIGIVVVLVGTTPYLALIISAIKHGQPALIALRESLMGPPNRAEVVLTTHFPFVHQVARALMYFAMNFPTPLALLAPLGIFWQWKNTRLRWFILSAGGIFVIDFVFAFRYLVPDQFVFFISAYVIFALFIGLAIPRIATPSRARMLLLIFFALLPISVYEVAPDVLRKTGFSLGLNREIPYRDSYSYFIRPRKNGEDSAERFCLAALKQAAPNGFLIADITIKNALVYVRDVQGVEPGVTLNTGLDTTGRPPIIDLTPDNVDQFLQNGGVFVCSMQRGYVPDWLFDRYEHESAGVIYRLKSLPKTVDDKSIRK